MFYVIEWYEDNEAVSELFKTQEEAEQWMELCISINEAFGTDSLIMVIEA